MIYAIIGGRDFDNYTYVKEVMSRYDDVTGIVSGGAKGADSLGAKYAFDNDLKLITHLPDWDKYGRGAGFVRNKLIIDDADFVVAFWDGKSKGTKNSIDLAKKQNKPIEVWSY